MEVVSEIRSGLVQVLLPPLSPPSPPMRAGRLVLALRITQRRFGCLPDGGREMASGRSSSRGAETTTEVDPQTPALHRTHLHTDLSRVEAGVALPVVVAAVMAVLVAMVV